MRGYVLANCGTLGVADSIDRYHILGLTKCASSMAGRQRLETRSNLSTRAQYHYECIQLTPASKHICILPYVGLATAMLSMGWRHTSHGKRAVIRPSCAEALLIDTIFEEPKRRPFTVGE